MTSPVIVVLVARKDVYFDYGIYNCVYLHYDQWETRFVIVNYVLWLTIPSVIVIATSTMLLMEARKARREGESLNWRGVSTVLLTALSFCVSTLPTVLFILTKHITGTSFSTEVKFRRTAAFLKQLNITANIYIYTATVPSFREFLACRVRMVVGVISRPIQGLEQRTSLLESGSE